VYTVKQSQEILRRIYDYYCPSKFMISMVRPAEMVN